MARYRSIQKLKDRLATVLITLGGVSVILALLLVMFYLIWIVSPTLMSPQVAIKPTTLQPSGIVHMALEKRGEQAFVLQENGQIRRVDAQTGEVLSRDSLLETDVSIEKLARTPANGHILAMQLSDQRLLAVLPQWKEYYVDGKRQLRLEFVEKVRTELGAGVSSRPFTAMAADIDDTRMVVAMATDEQKLLLQGWEFTLSFLTGEEQSTLVFQHSFVLPRKVDFLALNLQSGKIYALNKQGDLLSYAMRFGEQPELIDSFNVASGEEEIVDMAFLAGGESLLIANTMGYVTQWFEIRGMTPRLQRVRRFEAIEHTISAIVPERERRGFMLTDQVGWLHGYYSLDTKRLFSTQLSHNALGNAAIDAGNKRALVLDHESRLMSLKLDNPHPEISFSILMRPLHYEGYSEPSYQWQSSSAESDFEPKLSLIPLMLGSFKAAFYGMLLAIPLALLGAVFTAQFMDAATRKLIKPGIEIMEALPTVILGFMAGLWLAPIVESNLIGTLLIFVLVPIGVIAWVRVLTGLKGAFAARFQGREFVTMIPLLLIVAAIALWMGEGIENLFFDRDMPQWMFENLGITYRQRNAFIVGIAIGFAVIPTIFSISEDALFNVPKSLINGSLALGASQWQTLVYVVLPTASPAIFSAVMIGLGRAIGETMIVLMATGNTPILDFSVFQGMRTLSANLAIELPESEVGGSHFRLLFLSALVLFMFAFLINALAEVVRQRLRMRYGRL